MIKPKKLKKIENSSIDTEPEEKFGGTDFQTILGSIVNDQKDPYLVRAYELIVNSKDVNIEDIMFL